MKEAWYLSLPRASIALAADLRLHEDIELLEDGDGLWLRGRHAEGSLLLALRSLPGARLFHASAGDRLREEHHRLWNRTSPRGEWVPLHRWALPTAPATVPVAPLVPRTRIRLVADDAPATTRAVITRFDHWSTYSETAAACRLESLEFAVSTEDQVLVRGLPVPPLPGTYLAEKEGVLHPIGTRWYPPLHPSMLRDLVDAVSDDLILITPGRIEILEHRHRVAATRAAVRAARRGGA